MPTYHVQFVNGEKTRVETDGFTRDSDWIEFASGRNLSADAGRHIMACLDRYARSTGLSVKDLINL